MVRFIAILATTVLLASVSLVVLSRTDVTTVDDALEQFRATPSPSPDRSSPPSPSPTASPVDQEPSPTEAATSPTGQSQATEPPRRTDPPKREVTASEPSEGSERRPSSSPTDAPASWQTPAGGVYVYTSSGYESVDVPGGRRTMPDDAPLTVRETPSGFSTRLQPYSQHVDIREFRYDGQGIHMDRWFMERTFFGQTVAQDYDCTGNAAAWTRGAQPGHRTTFRCGWNGKADLEGTYTLQGYEDLVLGDGSIVAGVPHVVVDATITGEVEGESRLDIWLHPETGLGLREIRDIEADTPSPMGRVTYREESEFHLQSLTSRT